MDANTAIMVVGGAGGYKLLELIINYFFKRVTRDDYITQSACEACSKTDEATIKHLSDEVHTIKGILLVIAVKVQIDPSQLAKLTR